MLFKSCYVLGVQEVAVGSLCDNIEVESKTGDLWMGCHPNGVKFLLRDPNDPPGSEVCLWKIHVHTVYVLYSRVEGVLTHS